MSTVTKILDISPMAQFMMNNIMNGMRDSTKRNMPKFNEAEVRRVVSVAVAAAMLEAYEKTFSTTASSIDFQLGEDLFILSGVLAAWGASIHQLGDDDIQVALAIRSSALFEMTKGIKRTFDKLHAEDPSARIEAKRHVMDQFWSAISSNKE